MAEPIDTTGIDPELLKNPDFQRVLADALAIQDRLLRSLSMRAPEQVT